MHVAFPALNQALQTAALSAVVMLCTGATADQLIYREEARIQAGNAAPGDIFGYNLVVSSDGATIVVGAQGGHNSGGVDAGNAYVFAYTNGTWTEQAQLQASDAAAG